MPALSRGRRSGRRSRGGSSSFRPAKKAEESVKTAAVARGLFNINRFIDPVHKFVADLREDERKLDCKLYNELYDECKSASGPDHPECRSYRKFMHYKECDDCLQSDQGPAVSSTRSSIIRYFIRVIAKRDWQKKCLYLQDCYDECRSKEGGDHPRCQNYRQSMMEDQCDDCLNSGTCSNLPSIRKLFQGISEVDRRSECNRLKELYDKCSSNMGSGNTECENHLKQMCGKKCPGVESGG